MAVLVTGGAGYIGSHTCVELINAGQDVVILDNFYNCKHSSLDRIRALVDRDFKFYECDIRDREGLNKVFETEDIDCVIHFAGLKAVGESVHKPLEYFDNNVNGTLVLLDVMRHHGCKKIIFSSSATVYGMNNIAPFTEDMEIGGVTNPYGRTKYMIECILQDLYVSDPSWSICLLRYFNPIGAHKSGTMGEDPNGIPNNLMPYITQVAVGKLKKLGVFGNDYPTPDGTGVRDYIHVVDLALGHVKAVEKLEKDQGLFIYNLGTGIGGVHIHFSLRVLKYPQTADFVCDFIGLHLGIRLMNAQQHQKSGADFSFYGTVNGDGGIFNSSYNSSHGCTAFPERLTLVTPRTLLNLLETNFSSAASRTSTEMVR